MVLDVLQTGLGYPAVHYKGLSYDAAGEQHLAVIVLATVLQ